MDIEPLKKSVDDYIEHLRSPDSHEDDDSNYKHNITSKAIGLLYGPKAFEEIIKPLLDARDQREEDDEE